MDYLRIYRDFIRDRMGKPPVGVIGEDHHILPRCMGGTDDDWNMIRLTPGDHFFAHLCLAKAHQLRDLWLAVFLMLADPKQRKHRKAVVGGRREYTWLSGRRWDQTVYHFSHDDGRHAHLRRFEMEEKYGISAKDIARVATGALGSRKGWMLHATRLAGNRIRNPGRGKMYTVLHPLHGEFRGTLADLSRHIDESGANLLKMFAGETKQTKGWYLKGNAPPTQRRGKLQTFVHPDHGEVTGTQRKIAEHIGCREQDVCSVVHGRQISVRGWTLKGAEPRPSPFKTVTFEHPQFGRFTGHGAAAARHIGARSTDISATISGKQKSVKGWRYVPAPVLSAAE